MDEHEFASFAAEAGARLHNLAAALCGNTVDADDLVQSTFERLYRSWLRGAPDSPFAYARIALVRTHISDRRRLRWRREITSEVVTARGGSTGESSEERIVLQEALAKLPTRQRQAVVLRYLEDLPLTDVAELMSCSEGNVKRSAHDGLQNLRALLDSNTHEVKR